MNALRIAHLSRVALLGLLVVAAQAAAQGSERHKVVAGVDVHYGVVSAQEVARKHPKSHAEGRMHGGAPSGKNDYHVEVAMFDQASGKRITDAEVWATVGDLGLAGKRRKLEPEGIDDGVSFGNYFPMRGAGPFRILVEVRLPGRAKPVEATFDHRLR